MGFYPYEFNLDQEIDNFWQIHPRFGITRIENRLILITKNKQMSRKIEMDLRAWATAEGQDSTELARPYQLPRSIPGYAIDVTNIIPRWFRGYHQRYCNANCWGTASFVAKVSSGLFDMDAEEFHHWATSALAKRVSGRQRIKIGDMVVFRLSNKENFRSELHAGIFISEDLVISKSRTGEGRIFLQDADEMRYIFGPFYNQIYRTNGVRVDFLRMESLESFVFENRLKIPSDLENALADLARAEQMAHVLGTEFPEGISPTTEQIEKRQRERKAYRFEKLELAIALGKRATLELTSIPVTEVRRKSLRWTLWKGIQLRARSLSVN